MLRLISQSTKVEMARHTPNKEVSLAPWKYLVSILFVFMVIPRSPLTVGGLILLGSTWKVRL